MKTKLYLVVLVNLLLVFDLHAWVENDLLRPERPGESRPVWWYDIWYGNGVILEATIVKLPKYQQDAALYSSQKNGHKLKKYAYYESHIVINKVLRADKGVNRLHGLKFTEGATIKVLFVYEFEERTGQWGTRYSAKKNERTILYLEENAFPFDGHFTIRWDINREKLNLVENILTAKKNGHVDTVLPD
jgi:hypothetical protein